MQNVMQIATNAGHTAQNDSWTAQNDGPNPLNVCQRPAPWAPGDPPTTLILEKTLVSRNDF